MNWNTSNTLQQRREQVKRYRKRFWRAKEAVEEASRDDEDWRKIHHHFHSATELWLHDLFILFEKAAESGDESYAAMWTEEEFGPFTGLEEVREDIVREDVDDLLAPELLEEIGLTLDEACMRGLDLPTQPPVVDDPWSPDEGPDADDFDLPESMINR